MTRLPRSIRTLALICSPVLFLGSSSRQPAPRAPQPYVYTGTIHAVQPSTMSLDLITGVGHALRLIHISALPATQTMRGAVAIGFADLAPGDQMRAECRMTASGLVADRIEKLPPPGQGL